MSAVLTEPFCAPPVPEAPVASINGKSAASLRIGHWMPRLWTAGGVAAYVRRLTDAQVAAGHRVFFYELCGDPANPAREPTRRLPGEAALWEAAASDRLDVMHLHESVAGGVAAARLPWVRTVHGHRQCCPSGSRFLRNSGRACDREAGVLACARGHLLDRCGPLRPAGLIRSVRLHGRELSIRGSLRAGSDGRVLAMSLHLRNEMLRHGWPADRIDFVPLPGPVRGAAAAAPAPPPNAGSPARFLCLGRLVEEKGVDTAIRAVARLDQSGIDVALDIAGSGRAEKRLRRLAADLGLGERACFHGWVDSSGSAALFASARAVLFPARWHEPAGLVALEAMAAGRAVVASAVGGLPETVEDGVNGLLVEPGNPAALAIAIERLANDLGLAARLGAAGCATATARSMTAHLAATVAAYRAAIQPSTASEKPTP